MDDFINLIIKKTRALDSRIETKEKLITVYERIYNKKNYNSIFATQTIIYSCLQCGNYRRAVRYIVVTERLVDEFEKNEGSIKDIIDKYFIKD